MDHQDLTLIEVCCSDLKVFGSDWVTINAPKGVQIAKLIFAKHKFLLSEPFSLSESEIMRRMFYILS